MSPRTRYHVILFVAWPVGAMLIAAVAHWAFQPLVALVLCWALLLGRWLKGIRCPSCDKEVAVVADKVRSFSRRRTIIPRNCDECGGALDQRSPP
jgi:hypothetical protein